MSDSLRFEITGIDEVLLSLEKLPSRIQRKLIYETNRDILKTIVLPDAKSGIPYSTATKKGVKVVKARGTDTGVYVGVTTDSFWLRFLEFGTAERATKGATTQRRQTKRYKRLGRVGASGGGARRGRVNANPQLVRILESKTKDVLRAVQERYDQHFAKALTANLKKYKKRKI